MTTKRRQLGSVVFAMLMITSVFTVATLSSAAAEGDSGGFAVVQGSECYDVTAFGDGSQNVSAFYDYQVPNESFTYSSHGTTHLQENQVSNLFVYDGSNGTSLVMLHDKLDEDKSGDGAYGSTITFNITGLPEDREWAVEDDSYGNDTDDNFSHSTTSSQIDWMWGPYRTDGAAVRGLESDQYTNVTIDPAFNEEAPAWGDWSWSGDEQNSTKEWRLLTADGQNVTLNRTQEVKIRKGSCDAVAPTAALTANATSTAVGGDVQFDASNSSDNENISEYEWDFDGDGAVDETTADAVVTHAYDTVGDYNATVTVKDGSGNAASANVSITVTDETDPVARADVPETVMATDTFTADGNASSDNGAIVSYEWTFGDGTNATGANVSHSYESNGTYTVTLTVTDSAGNNNTTTAQVEAVEPDNEAPNASLAADPTSASVNHEVQFDASNSTDNQQITEYRWDFDGDGTVDATTEANTTSHTYTATGEYDATVTVADIGGNTDEANVTVSVTDKTAPVATADVPETVGANVTFAADAGASTDNGDIASYDWDFGDNATKSGEVVEHAYAETGSYTVTLTVTDSAGNENTTTATVNVTENATSESPNAAVTVDPTSPMANQTASFDANESTDDGQIAKYYWDFDGDGTVDATTTGPETTYAYEAEGTYDATVTVRDDGGQTDTASVSVEVKPDDGSDKPPVAKVDAPNFAHVGDKRLYNASNSTDDKGIVKYIWDFNGDGKTRTTEFPEVYHRYSWADYHNGTLTVVDESGQKDTVHFEVNVVDNEKPNATVTVPDTVKPGEQFNVSANITDNGAVPKVCWWFDETTGPKGANSTFAFDEPGAHAVTLVLKDTGGNKRLITRQVTVEGASNGGNNGGNYDGGHDHSDHDHDDGTTVDKDDSNDDWTHYTVDDANTDDEVTMNLPADVDDSGVRYGELSLLFTAAGDYELDVQTTATAPNGTAVPTPDADGFELLSYLTVDSQPQLTDETVANATFSFSVEKDRLSTMGVETEDVSLYQLTNGSWERVPTERTGETETAYEFAANPSEMAVFAVGVDRPAIRVTDVELGSTSVAPGDAVDVTATIQNDGKANGTYAVNLTVDGEVVDTREVTVPEDGSITATFTHTVDSAGSYEISVNGVTKTLDVGASSIQVSDLSISESSVTVGDSVDITATVTNDGTAEGTYTAELTLDGEVVDTREVTVPAGDSATVTFTRSIDEAGTYELSVDGVTAQVDVQSANTSTTPASDGGVPGFGPVVALLALAGAALLARRRL